MAADRRRVCVWRKCPLPPGNGHRPSPGLSGAAEQPQPRTLPSAPEPCCRPGDGGWDIIIVIIINQLLEMGFQQLSWALGSFPPHPWAARGGGGWGWAQPHPSLWLCLLPQPGWPDLALPPAPGLFGAATLSPDSAAEKPRRDLSRSQSQAPETKCAR